MAAPAIVPGSFLDHYRKSGLIDDAGLEAMPEDLRTLPDKELAERLIADDTLTRWQADKLLAGKYKGFKLGKYKLLGLIGKGGMSAVYLGEHAVMRRRSAIKVLPSARVDDASYLGRFHREAEAIASLNHNNIVRAYDVDVEQTRNQEIHFLAMEYVDGPPLSEVVTDRGLLTFAETVEIVRQTCEGLDHAHAAGLVHRDIKPSNLLVDREGVVKILDLGLARFFDEGDDTGSLTVAHDERVLGTADYLAPEQAVDSHTVDERADLYSLGCTCYYLLTGAPPFTDQSLAKRLLAHQTRTPEPLRARRPDTPDSVERLVERMMEKKADDRFASARELAEACEQWLADNHPHAPVALRGLNDVKFLERQKITLEAVSEPGSESHLAGSSTLGGRVPGAGDTNTAFLKALNDSDISIIGVEDDTDRGRKGKSSPDDTSSAGGRTTINKGKPADAETSDKQDAAKPKPEPAAKPPASLKELPAITPSTAIVKAPPPARRKRAIEIEEEQKKKQGDKKLTSSTMLTVVAVLLFVLVGAAVLYLGMVFGDADLAGDKPIELSPTTGNTSVGSKPPAAKPPAANANKKPDSPAGDGKPKLARKDARAIVVKKFGQETFNGLAQKERQRLINQVMKEGPDAELVIRDGS